MEILAKPPMGWRMSEHQLVPLMRGTLEPDQGGPVYRDGDTKKCHIKAEQPDIALIAGIYREAQP
ncbi:hypothetical protein PG989_004836 [Apiospora arundinis]